MSRAEDEDGRDTEKVVVRDRRKIKPDGTASGEPVSEENAKEPAGSSDRASDPEEAGEATVVQPGLGAELEALRAELDERTRDLQRVTAEYANYRKRVDRDRGAAAEQTTGAVLSALLPVLDDIDRAREHGDLVGPFATVAEALTASTAKFGLVAFGEKGDPFDPHIHEALLHAHATGIDGPTCVEILQPGYQIGDKVLRPARVAVAEPDPDAAPELRPEPVEEQDDGLRQAQPAESEPVDGQQPESSPSSDRVDE